MTYTYIAYIDESGDDGLTHQYRAPGKGGQSHWLSIGATVWRASRDLEAVQWAKTIIENLPESKRKKSLHFVNLNHSQRIMAVKELKNKPIRTICIMAHKPSLMAEVYKDKNQLYHYLCRYLLERLSWFCRDMRPNVLEGNGKVKIIFSRRGGMSYGDFKDYLDFLKLCGPSTSIYWPVIDIEGIDALDMSNRYGLQIADTIISAVTAAIEPDPYGNFEPRFAKALKPTFYEYKQKYLGYGAKIVPSEETTALYQRYDEFVQIFR